MYKPLQSMRKHFASLWFVMLFLLSAGYSMAAPPNNATGATKAGKAPFNPGNITSVSQAAPLSGTSICSGSTVLMNFSGFDLAGASNQLLWSPAPTVNVDVLNASNAVVASVAGVTVTSTALSPTLDYSIVTTSFTFPNGVAAGTYSLRVTLTGYGSPSTTVVSPNGATFAVATRPTITSTLPTGANPFCAGTTSPLTITAASDATTPTFVWQYRATSMAAYTNTLPGGATAAAGVLNFPSSTTAATGQYAVYVTDAATGCISGVSSATTVTVNPSPGAVTSSALAPATGVAPNQSVCTGSLLQLSATSSGATLYVWSGPNSFSNATQMPVASAAATTANQGIYTVTASNMLGCTSTGSLSVSVFARPVATATTPTPICAGTNIVLTGGAAAMTSYAWSGPNSYSGAVQSPTIAGATPAMSGTYTITVTDANACTASATASVVVNNNPTAGADIRTGTPRKICEATTLKLTGSPIMAGLTYTWTGSNGFSSTDRDPDIAGTFTGAAGNTNTMAGIQTLTYMVTVADIATSCTTTASTSAEIVVIPRPTLSIVSDNTMVANNISDPGALCTGGAAVLTATPGYTPSAGTTFSWTGPTGAFASTAATLSLSALTTANSGAYTVTVRNISGTVSCSATNTNALSMAVNVMPIATAAAGRSTYCTGQTIMLTAGSSSVGPITGYVWAGSSGSIGGGTSANATVTGAAVGSQTYNVTVSNGGCKTWSGTNVSVVSQPAASIVTAGTTQGQACEGQTLTFQADPGTAAVVTYAWTGPNGFTSNIFNPSIVGSTTAATGTYTVVVSNGTCTSSAATAIVVFKKPVAAITASTMTICTGQSVSLTASGGVIGEVYNWTAAPGTVTPNTSSAAITSAGLMAAPSFASENYVFTVDIWNGMPTCNAGVSKTIAVKQTPVPTFDPALSTTTAACQGQPISFAIIPGTTAVVAYAWTGPNAFTSTLSNPSVTSSATTAMSGAYVVTVSNGSCSATTQRVLTVYQRPVATVVASAAQICQGQTVALTADGGIVGEMYSWSPFPSPITISSSTAKTITASAMDFNSSPYSFTVSVWNGLVGCNSTAAVTVAVKDQPTASIVAAGTSTKACEGQTVTFEATTATVQVVTYAWSGPNGFTSASRTPSIAVSTTSASGTYTVTVSNGTCTATATTSLTVYKKPIATITPARTAICSGETLAMTADGGSGAGEVYSWSVSGPPITLSSLTAKTVTASAMTLAGSPYTFSVNIWNGFATCSSTVAGTTTITVATSPNPMLVAAGTTQGQACAGQTVTFQVDPQIPMAGVTYAWAGPNGFVSNVYNPSIIAATTAATGTYTVTVANGSCTAALMTAINVFAKPVAAITASTMTICTGQSVSLTASGGVIGEVYNWTAAPGTVTPNTTSAAITSAGLTATPSFASEDKVFTVDISNGMPTCNTQASKTIKVLQTPVATFVAAGSTGAGMVCQGQPISLQVDPGTTAIATYAWGGPSGFTSNIYNPTITSSAQTTHSGAYTVTVGNGSCTATASRAFDVKLKPVATVVASAAQICQGQTVTLTADGGVAGEMYSWSPFPGPVTISSSTTKIITASAMSFNSSPYSFTVSVWNGLVGCNTTAAVTVAVKDQPTASIVAAGTTTAACEGQTVTFEATTATVQVVTYAWSGPNGFTSASRTPSITSATTVASGTYSVTVSNGTCTATATTSLTVYKKPVAAITGTGTICTGQSVVLTVTGGVTGESYSWAAVTPNGSATLAGATTTGTATATVTTTGLTAAPGFGSETYTYSVDVYNTMPTCKTTATKTVTVLQAPTPTFVAAGSTGAGMVCQGQPISLQVDPGTTAITTFAWAGPNGFTSNISNPVITTSAQTTHSGTYTVTVGNGSCTATASRAFDVKLKPAALIFASSSTICAGQPVTLAASGGVAGEMYNWTAAPGTVTPNLTSSTITSTGLVAGTQTFAVSVWNGLVGCATTFSKDITVLAAPTATSALFVAAGTTQGQACAGQTLTFQVDPGVPMAGITFAWSGPNGFTSSVYNPQVLNATTASTGTYSVTISNGSCSVALNTAINVFAKPVAAITGTGTICTGQSVVLTVTGGVTGESYSWAAVTPNGSATLAGATTTGTATATVTTTGLTAAPGFGSETYTYSVDVYNTMPTCKTTATKTVTVLQAPTPTFVAAGSTAAGMVCQGQPLSVQITPGTTAIATFAWAGPNGFTSNISNPVITTSAQTTHSGTYTVTVGNGSCTATASRAFDVKLKPVATVVASATQICQGQTLTLTADGGVVGEMYSWSPSGAPITLSAIDTKTITASAMTTAASPYSFTATIWNGLVGCSTSATISGITVKTTPTANIIAAGTTVKACEGQPVNFQVDPALPLAGLTFAWAGPSGFTASTATPQIPAATTANTGTYTVTVNNGSCTATTSTTLTVYVKPVATVSPSTTNVCSSGGTITLTADGGVVGEMYSWAVTGGAAATISGFVAKTITASGLTVAGSPYTFVGTVYNGIFGCNTSVSRVVTVSQNPTPAFVTTPPATVCPGTTLNFSVDPGIAMAGVTFSWSGPNGFTASTYNPSVASATSMGSGVYSVSVINGVCTATLSRSVAIGVVPTSVTLLANNPVVAGSPINLTAVTMPNMLGVTAIRFTGPAGYNVLGNNSATSGTSSIPTTNTATYPAIYPVNPPANGVTMGIYYVIVDVCGGASLTSSVTVTDQPAPVYTAGSNAPVVSGAALNLTVNSGGSGYTWSGPNGFSSTAQNPTLSPVTIANAGVYTVSIASAPYGTITATVSVGVTVAPTPPVAPTPVSDLSFRMDILHRTIYNGDNTYITVLVTNAGPNAAPNVEAKIVLPAEITYQTGPYTMLNASGVSIAGQTVTVTAPSIAAGQTYMWRFNVKVAGIVGTLYVVNGQITASGANDPDSTPNNNIVAEDDQNYIDTRIVPTPTARLGSSDSMTSEDAIKVRAYPNPATDFVTVDINLEQPAKASIKLVDALGRTMIDKSSDSESLNHRAEMNISNLEGGMYYLKVEAGDKQITKKVVKSVN